MPVKLYTYDPAPNPRRVALLLKYKGVQLDTQQVDLTKGQQMSAEFSAINPQWTVPALELDDGEVLTDVIAICFYLDSLYPEKSVFGSNALERAKIIAFCQRLYVDGLAAVAEILRNGNPVFKDRALPGALNVPQIPELVDRGHLRMDAFYQVMNKAVSGREFLIGDQLSQADIDLYAVLGFCGWVKRSIPVDCEALIQWFERMKQRFGE